MRISEHFTWEDVTRSSAATRLGISNVLPPDYCSNAEVAAMGMEKVRGVLGFPIFVDSWYRCAELNAALKGSLTSDHVQAYAVDFVCPRFGTPKEVCLEILKHDLAFNQLIYEGTWVHVSFAPALRRQVLTAHFSGGKVTYTKEIEV